MVITQIHVSKEGRSLTINIDPSPASLALAGQYRNMLLSRVTTESMSLFGCIQCIEADQKLIATEGLLERPDLTITEDMLRVSCPTLEKTNSPERKPCAKYDPHPVSIEFNIYPSPET